VLPGAQKTALGAASAALLAGGLWVAGFINPRRIHLIL
jgi:hypothetical protein